jgi:hypothetical protein
MVEVGAAVAVAVAVAVVAAQVVAAQVVADASAEVPARPALARARCLMTSGRHVHTVQSKALPSPRFQEKNHGYRTHPFPSSSLTLWPRMSSDRSMPALKALA